MTRIAYLEKEILPLKNSLTHHKLYSLLSDLDDIKVFMEKHVYAVWDFMSLLKALQNQLTCTTLPWKPVANATTARFINEIVFGEESDLNEAGVPKSHFEMYLDAMQEVGANTKTISKLVVNVDKLEDLEQKFAAAGLEKAETEFLQFTFEVIKTNQAHKIAAAFTFGREDLIPDMFIEIIKQSSPEGSKKYPKLSYYLERHIEVDGDEHGPLSLAMVQELCGDDEQKWEEALRTAQAALAQRIQLWDAIAAAIQTQQQSMPVLG